MAAILLVAGAAPALAQEWPTRPIKIIAPFAAGGNLDVVARIVAERLQPVLGQPVIVENKTGAGSIIGSEAVAHAAPDGYTLLITSLGLTTSPVLLNRTPYDWQKDFAFITALSVQPQVVLVNSKNPAKDFKEFLEMARKEPGNFTMGTAGAGSLSHLSGVLLEQRAGVKFEAVHYRGTAASLADLMAGQIVFQFEATATALPMVNDNRLKALAVTSLERAASLPNVPAIAESGVPGYEAINLLGLAGPANLPKPVIDRLSAAMKLVLTDPKVVARFSDLGTDARFTTPDAFFQMMKAQADTWIPVIRKAQIKLE
jgi:tripartite-type tricarboxylate transporter receptor subunit TctC